MQFLSHFLRTKLTAPFLTHSGMDMTLTSFNHGGRTNLEANRTTRWKKPGPLNELVEQSPLPLWTTHLHLDMGEKQISILFKPQTLSVMVTDPP